MLWKCCTHYASKSGKLLSGHRTGKGQFSFQSPKRQCQRQCSNYRTIVLISHTSKVCSKFSKPGFSSTWTVNFQMFKLVLEKAEEPEIKLPTSAGSLKSKRVPENIFCFIDYPKAFDRVDHNKLWKILKEMGIPDYLTWLLRNCMQVRKQQLE